MLTAQTPQTISKCLAAGSRKLTGSLASQNPICSPTVPSRTGIPYTCTYIDNPGYAPRSDWNGTFVKGRQAPADVTKPPRETFAGSRSYGYHQSTTVLSTCFRLRGELWPDRLQELLRLAAGIDSNRVLRPLLPWTPGAVVTAIARAAFQ